MRGASTTRRSGDGGQTPRIAERRHQTNVLMIAGYWDVASNDERQAGMGFRYLLTRMEQSDAGQRSSCLAVRAVQVIADSTH